MYIPRILHPGIFLEGWCRQWCFLFISSIPWGTSFAPIFIILSPTRSRGGYIPGTKFPRGMMVFFIPIGFRWGIFSSNQRGIDIRLIFRLPLGPFIYYVSTLFCQPRHFHEFFEYFYVLTSNFKLHTARKLRQNVMFK